MRMQYIYPLDPACPEFSDFMERCFNDPMVQQAGIWTELREDFERSHRKECKRCQDFGLDNVDIDEDKG